MKMRIMAVIAALIFPVVGVVAASPAAAGNCSYIGSVELCGSVRAANSTKRSVLVTRAWPNTSGTYTKLLYAGQLSSNYSGFKDTDGFYVPNGCRARNTYDPSSLVYYPGWTKIFDTQDMNIEIYGC